MTFHVSTRDGDERLLKMIAARCAGWTSPDIAAVTGLRVATVRTMTNDVLTADAEHSGEAVEPAYWLRSTGSRSHADLRPLRSYFRGR